MIEKCRATGEETDFTSLKVSSNVKWFKSYNFNNYHHIIKQDGWYMIYFLIHFYLSTLCGVQYSMLGEVMDTQRSTLSHCLNVVFY